MSEQDIRTCPLEEWVDRRGLRKLWDDFAITLDMAGGVEPESIEGTLRSMFHSIRQHNGELGTNQAGMGVDEKEEQDVF